MEVVTTRGACWRCRRNLNGDDVRIMCVCVMCVVLGLWLCVVVWWYYSNLDGVLQKANHRSCLHVREKAEADSETKRPKGI